MSVGLGGSVWQTRDERFSERTGGGATFAMITGDAFACWTPFGDVLRSGACLGGTLQHLRSQGVGIRNATTSSVNWLGVRASLRGEAHLGRWFFTTVQLDAGFAPNAPRIVLGTGEGDVALYDIGAFSARFTIAAALNLF
ncbi:hypothetical protein AKJ09_02360 [Labilithrix luteola]|uniref:Uncharacterized protein n=1 Tax=Labilithrix luteola TaxID=1391654 RepID=A0A0K1PQN9_9BACT|nr:hypothetical protein [Labilithrix luteola]AKU95696.1 hypothetical protein AKJ09_02360 [Labilithrix luteola]